MKKIILSSGTILFLSILYFISLSRDKSVLDKPQLVISCKGNVHFDIFRPSSTVAVEGSISLSTLGSKRLALEFSGQLRTKQGRFTLNRTLMMNYLYHPENHVLELNYTDSHVKSSDTTPEDVFFQTILSSQLTILRLSQFSDNALLVSNSTSPLYVCIAQ